MEKIEREKLRRVLTTPVREWTENDKKIAAKAYKFFLIFLFIAGYTFLSILDRDLISLVFALSIILISVYVLHPKRKIFAILSLTIIISLPIFSHFFSVQGFRIFWSPQSGVLPFSGLYTPWSWRYIAYFTGYILYIILSIKTLPPKTSQSVEESMDNLAQLDANSKEGIGKLIFYAILISLFVGLLMFLLIK